MGFASLSEGTVQNMSVLHNESITIITIPELGYFGHTVAFYLIRTEWARNCHLQ